MVVKLINNGQCLRSNVRKSTTTHIGGFGSGLKLCRRKAKEINAHFSIKPTDDGYTEATIVFKNHYS